MVRTSGGADAGEPDGADKADEAGNADKEGLVPGFFFMIADLLWVGPEEGLPFGFPERTGRISRGTDSGWRNCSGELNGM
ncbi:hypothetical protein GCM10010329_61900 [Streptomyces spiroverticillatus]|uniref:Uncharacterized protein n=1 Tax=Streptomyces finlayi TaxID=67296 RepID=A0A918X627_9ACTN|nr:hypothetical protein GCM10010329_61900 [Streptomyces spiroverticillatus]GHD14950.1 hypothetical protein GCM10010334_74530 [Streptomyces finlayi]